MRLALKYQIIMAPAVVLCMMTLLLAFLQFTYWDMSLQRQEVKNLKTSYIALAEADMAAQRMQRVVHILTQAQVPDAEALAQLDDLYQHLSLAVERLQDSTSLSSSSLSLLQQGVADLNPDQGVQLEQFDLALSVLRPHLVQLLSSLNERRGEMSELHRDDMDVTVAETTFVSIVILGVAILLGIFLSLMFARRILRRIQILSESAERITLGEFTPPPAPERVQDELDGLAVSINRMTDQLIRVVSAEKLLEGAEEERRRIAMDIHDQTLADLSSVRRGIEHLRANSPCGDEAAKLEADLQRAMANLRVVMDNLHPQTLDILGLPAALESLLATTCEQTGAIEYHFMAGAGIEEQTLSPLVQITLYRIAVEAINNVLRHAHADRLEVNLTTQGEHLLLAVEDNGRGFAFEPRLPTATGGHGLYNIQERAKTIGATTDWRHSRFSSGTRFELMLPLLKE